MPRIPMDYCPSYRRRRRNRPSIHPRLIQIRQYAFKAYRLRRLARENVNGTGYAFCSTFFYACVTAVACLLAWSSFACYPSSSGALVSYPLYQASCLLLNKPVLQYALKCLGFEGEWSEVIS